MPKGFSTFAFTASSILINGGHRCLKLSPVRRVSPTIDNARQKGQEKSQTVDRSLFNALGTWPSSQCCGGGAHKAS